MSQSSSIKNNDKNPVAEKADVNLKKRSFDRTLVDTLLEVALALTTGRLNSNLHFSSPSSGELWTQQN